MITAVNDRYKFIGGSEANLIYMRYNTKTFKKWWSKKLSELPEEEISNKSMSVGTILEHEIMDLYERVNDVKGIRDKAKIKGIARANTDYILGKKISDIKASSKAFEWFISDKVPINYKRQLTHYLYVFELTEASIISYQVDNEILNNPFNELLSEKLFEIPVPITKQEIIIHKQILEYLEHCRDMNIFPKE